MQPLPSSAHAVPDGAKQLSVVSLHTAAHSVPPAQGSPAWTLQLPPPQVSAPLQKRPSLQDAVLFGCPQEPDPLHWSFVQPLPSSVQVVPDGAKQSSAVSLHTAAHSAPPAQGSPAWTPQVPPLHVSAPLQKTPSSHGAVLLECAQLPEPLHWSLVQPLPSSVQAVPPGAKQSSAASSQVDAHSLPPAQGSPTWAPQLPAEQVSAPLQKTPSSQGAVLLAWTQVPAPSHWSSVQALPSSVQAVSAASRVQADEQQSPSAVLPSSHCSLPSVTESPQTGM